MNGRLRLTASVIVTGILVIGVAGCASQSASKMGSGDVVADRQRLMKSVGANWGDIQAKAKAGNIEGSARHLLAADPGPVPGGVGHRQVQGQARDLAEVAGVRGRGQELRRAGREAS